MGYFQRDQRCLPLLYLLLFLILWPNETTWGGQRILRIGALFDLSGPYKDVGSAMLKGARLAIKALNPRLRKMGLSLELLVVDTSSQEGRLLLGAMKLRDKDKVLCLIGTSNPHLIGTLKAFSNGHRIPLILTSGRETLYPMSWRKIPGWTFSVSPDLGSMAKALFQRLRKSGIERIGILIQNQGSWAKDALWIKGYAPEFGLVVTGTDGFGKNDTDCITQLDHLKTIGAQVVLFRGEKGFLKRLLASLKVCPIDIALLLDMPLEPSFKNKLPCGIRIFQEIPPFMSSRHQEQGSQALDYIRFQHALEDIGIFSVDQKIAAAKAWDAISLVAETLFRGAYPTKNGILKQLKEGKQRGNASALCYQGMMGTFSPSWRDHIGLDPSSLSVLILRQKGCRKVDPNL